MIDWPSFRITCAENRGCGTQHWILLGFFALCVSLLAITSGRIEALAGVYTLAFPSVMGLFAVGNMLLESRPGSLPRDVRASWPTVGVALFARGAVRSRCVGRASILRRPISS